MDIHGQDLSSSNGDRTDGGRPGAHTVSLTEDETPSAAVIRAVSAVTNRPSTEIEPLYSAIDPDAVDGLCRRDGDGVPRIPGRLVFTYSGCEVVLEDDQLLVRQLQPE